MVFTAGVFDRWPEPACVCRCSKSQAVDVRTKSFFQTEGFVIIKPYITPGPDPLWTHTFSFIHTHIICEALKDSVLYCVLIVFVLLHSYCDIWIWRFLDISGDLKTSCQYVRSVVWESSWLYQGIVRWWCLETGPRESRRPSPLLRHSPGLMFLWNIDMNEMIRDMRDIKSLWFLDKINKILKTFN